MSTRRARAPRRPGSGGALLKRVERRYHPQDGSTELMTLEFTTRKKSRKPIEFVLDGDTYKFTPRKNAGVMLALADGDYAEVMKQTFDWLGDGLPEAQSKKIIDRLKDPDDDFDENDLQKLISELQKEIAGRPTT